MLMVFNIWLLYLYILDGVELKTKVVNSTLYTLLKFVCFMLAIFYIYVLLIYYLAFYILFERNLLLLVYKF